MTAFLPLLYEALALKVSIVSSGLGSMADQATRKMGRALEDGVGKVGGNGLTVCMQEDDRIAAEEVVGVWGWETCG